MKRSILIAGAIAFNLGVLVASSHAATDAPEGGKTNTLTVTKHVDTASPKLADVALNFAKFTTTYTPSTCAANGGKPGVQNGVPGCLLPGKGTPAGISDQGAQRVLTH